MINPVGIVYTTISKEHTQVAAVKNPFNEYIEAKSLLSQGMTRGVIISNADDPITTIIALNKQNDIHVNFYGIAIVILLRIFLKHKIQVVQNVVELLIILKDS